MPADATTVRPARPDDAEAVVAVATASWHAAYDEFLGPETVAATVEDWYDTERLAASADDEQFAFPVAERGGAVVGFAFAGPDRDGDVAILHRLYVHPDHWRAGIGGGLLGWTSVRLRERGCERLRLAVFAANDVGVGFYECEGFDRVAERAEQFDGETHREYVYEKSL